MVKDSAPEKWEYKEHTGVKHKLLSKYFSTWIRILGTGGKRKLTYFDCFAGRGQMIDGSDGSPVIAIKIADRNAKLYREMVFTFIEKNTQNFDNLTQVLQTLKQEIENVDKITIVPPIHNDFNSSVNQIFDSLDAQRRTIAPSLFFIDPFGYSGIPLDTIKKILSYPRTEIFFTFMVSSITRFLPYEPVSETLTSLFGTDEWTQVIGQPNEERALVDLYRKQIHETAAAKYSDSFRISESDRARTLYYLIHATNSLKGHYVMKDIMYKEGAHGSFEYLGPLDFKTRTQAKLFDVHDITEVGKRLLDRFKGETLTFNDVLERMCIPWDLEPRYKKAHYRKAILQLEIENQCSVERISSRRTVREEDRITFFPTDNLNNAIN